MLDKLITTWHKTLVDGDQAGTKRIKKMANIKVVHPFMVYENEAAAVKVAECNGGAADGYFPVKRADGKYVIECRDTSDGFVLGLL